MLQVNTDPTFEPKQRRRHIERLLRERRLLVDRRDLGSVSQRADDRDTFFPRLAKAFFELGPVFAAFGRFLGTRADLFPARDAFKLQDIPECSDVVPVGDIAQQLRRNFGDEAEEVVPYLEERARNRDLFQIHEAHLPDGSRWSVRVLPENRQQRLAKELEWLEILRPVFARRGWLEKTFDSVLHRFRADFKHQLDGNVQTKALERLATAGHESGLWTTPTIHPRLRGKHVLVIARPANEPLTRILSTADPVTARQLALKACHLWLRLALTHEIFPLDLSFGLTADGEWILDEGSFHTLPPGSRANLWSYLRATAAHDPDQAFTCLEREIGPPSDQQTRFELRQQIRQAVPFRDGSWSPQADCLTENLMLHWRYLDEKGLRAPPHLERFYRALFALSARFEKRVERPDLLREALEDLEWSAGQAQFRRLLEPTQMGESLNAALSTFMELPQRVDHLLDLLSRDEGPPIRVRPSRSDRRQQNRVAAVIGLLLFLIGGILLTDHPGFVALLGAWHDIARTVLFVILGAGILFLIGGRQ